MAGKRVAQLRHALAENDSVPSAKKWSVIERPGRLEAVFSRAQGLRDNLVNLSRWKSMGEAAPVFAEAYCKAFASSRESSRASAAGNIASGLCQYLAAKGVRIDAPDAIPPELGTAFLDYLKGRDVDHPVALSVETQRHYYGVFKKIVLQLHKMDPKWTAIRIPPKPFAGVPRKSKPKELDRAAWAAVMKAAVAECLLTMDEVWPQLERVRTALTQKKKGGVVNLGVQPKQLPRY